MSDSEKRWYAGSGQIPPEWGKGLIPCRDVHGARILRCEGWVYLVGPLPYEMTGVLDDEDMQLIRLGFATDLHARIKTHAEYIRPGANPLLVAIPGTRADERFFHKLFADFRYDRSMYWGNESLRAAAVAALASYDGDIGEYLYGARQVFPADWVEEQMLWVASRFKRDGDWKNTIDPTAPFRSTMDILLRQIAMYAHVNLAHPEAPKPHYAWACADREFVNQKTEFKQKRARGVTSPSNIALKTSFPACPGTPPARPGKPPARP